MSCAACFIYFFSLKHPTPFPWGCFREKNAFVFIFLNEHENYCKGLSVFSKSMTKAFPFRVRLWCFGVIFDSPRSCAKGAAGCLAFFCFFFSLLKKKEEWLFGLKKNFRFFLCQGKVCLQGCPICQWHRMRACFPAGTFSIYKISVHVICGFADNVYSDACGAAVALGACPRVEAGRASRVPGQRVRRKTFASIHAVKSDGIALARLKVHFMAEGEKCYA